MADKIPTRDGDVIVRCFSDKPTPHRVTLIVKDGEQSSEVNQIVLGRVDAIKKAETLRAEGGTIFLHEDGRWKKLDG